MAKSSQSAFLPGLSGRLGGLVVRRSSGGSVISSCPVVNRRVTVLQQAQRDFMAIASRAWATLDVNERRAWGYVALGGEAGLLKVTPSLQSGLPTFLRWYQAFLWCGVTPAVLTPNVAVYDNTQAFTAIMNFRPIFPASIVTAGPLAPDGLALWVAHANTHGEAVSRPAWQLIAASGLGDAIVWQWNVAPFANVWHANVDALLSARLWCPTRPYTLMIRLRSTVSAGSAVLRNNALAVVN